jgi:hypothetical protein
MSEDPLAYESRNVAKTGRPIGSILVLGLGIETCLIAMLAFDDLRFHIPAFLGLFGTAFGLYVLALFRIRSSVSISRATVPVILCFSTLFRLTLLFSPASLSDDIYRYIWEGKIVLEGENPFIRAPANPELFVYRDAYFDKINHKGIPTIYPPVAQSLFALSQILYPHPISMKGILVLADLILILLLWHMLVKRGRDPRHVLFYAWHPLDLQESARGGARHLLVALNEEP